MTTASQNRISIEAALERDPRQAPWGIFAGSSCALSSVQLFAWFASPADLANYLVSGLAEGYDFDEEDLIAFRARVTPFAKRVEAEGLNAQLLGELNQAIKDDIAIEWWGQFDELTANETGFARQISSGFLGEGETGRAIAADELDRFVDYLKSCGC